MVGRIQPYFSVVVEWLQVSTASDIFDQGFNTKKITQLNLCRMVNTYVPHIVPFRGRGSENRNIGLPQDRSAQTNKTESRKKFVKQVQFVFQ